MWIWVTSARFVNSWSYLQDVRVTQYYMHKSVNSSTLVWVAKLHRVDTVVDDVSWDFFTKILVAMHILLDAYIG